MRGLFIVLGVLVASACEIPTQADRTDPDAPHRHRVPTTRTETGDWTVLQGRFRVTEDAEWLDVCAEASWADLSLERAIGDATIDLGTSAGRNPCVTPASGAAGSLPVLLSDDTYEVYVVTEGTVLSDVVLRLASASDAIVVEAP